MMHISEAGRRLAMSFVVAFVLWTFVTLTQNPEDYKIFEVPIQLQNIPTDLVVVDEKGQIVSNYGTVQVEAWAAINTLNQIRDGDLKAIVDLSKAAAAVQNFPVTIENSRTGVGYISYKKYNAQVELRLDQVRTVELPIRVDMRNYTAASVAFDAPTAKIKGPQTTVQIRASQTLLKRIKEAKVVVEVPANITAGYESSLPVIIVDEADKPVTGATLSPDTIAVNVDIRAKIGSKQVVILPQITGYVAPGFRLREVRLNKATVSIAGGTDIVEKTQNVLTMPIDVTNLSESITQTVRLVVPANTSLIEAQSATIEVGLVLEAVVQPVRMRIPVAVTLVDIPEGLTMTANADIVTIDVVASPATLQRGALTLVRAVASVGQWDAANSYRQVAISLPDDVKIVGNVPVVQLVTVGMPTVEPTIEQTATVTATLGLTVTPTLTATATKTVP